MSDLVAPEPGETLSGAAFLHPKLSAPALLGILHRCLHASEAEWIFFRELKVGTGRRNGSIQRLDAFALNCLPHQAMKRVCYEVKLSRADYFCELRHPLKRRIGMRFSNEFYFVTPGGLLEISDVPADCGVVEAGYATAAEWTILQRRQSGYFHYNAAASEYCMVTVPARWRDTPGPTWQFAAAMLRNQKRCLENAGPLLRPEQRQLPFE